MEKGYLIGRTSIVLNIILYECSICHKLMTDRDLEKGRTDKYYCTHCGAELEVKEE